MTHSHILLSESEILINCYAFYTSTLLMLKYYAHLLNYAIGMCGMKSNQINKVMFREINISSNLSYPCGKRDDRGGCGRQSKWTQLCAWSLNNYASKIRSIADMWLIYVCIWATELRLGVFFGVRRPRGHSGGSAATAPPR